MSQAAHRVALAIPMTHQSIPDFTLPVVNLMLFAGLIVAAGQLCMTLAYRYLEVTKGASM